MTSPSDRLPGEPPLWYGRFLRFLHMPKPRSAAAICNAERDEKRRRRAKDVPTSWRKRIEQFQWYARAEAYDMAAIEQFKAEQESLRRKQQEEHLQKCEAQRQREVEDAAAMRKKGLAVLDLPHVKQRSVTPDGTQVEILPQRAPEFSAVTRLLETSHKLARKGLEMVEERKSLTVTWEDEAKELGLNPDDLVEHFIRQYRGAAAARAESIAGKGVPPVQNGTGNGANSEPVADRTADDA